MKPIEYWIYSIHDWADDSIGRECIVYPNKHEGIHVIEYSAYENILNALIQVDKMSAEYSEPYSSHEIVETALKSVGLEPAKW